MENLKTILIMDDIKDLINKANDCLRLAEVHIHRDAEAFKRYINLAERYNNLASELLKYETFKHYSNERT